MKNLKNIFAAIILLSTLTTTITASTSNEIEINYCFDNGGVLALEIPGLQLSTDIELLQSIYEAPVTIKLSANGATVEMVIDGDGINPLISGDGINPLISGDGINPLVRIDGDGINPLISGDGINPRARIDGDGINPLISGDGINPLVNVTVSQLGTVLFNAQL